MNSPDNVRSEPESAADSELLAAELPPLKSIQVFTGIYEGGAGQICYREAGESNSQVVLMLHGMGSSSAGYRGQLAGLSKKFRTIAWDAPGFGQSTPLASDNPAAEEYAAALESFLDALGIRKVHALVGSSLGSVMATAFAAAHPARLGNLILLSPSTARGNATAEERAAEMGPWLKTADVDIPVDRQALAGRLLAPEAPDNVRAHVVRLRDAMTNRGWAQAIKMFYTVYTPDLVGRLSTPMAFAVGAEDRITPRASNADMLAAAAPAAKLRVMHGRGHMLKLEAPGEVNTLIEEMIMQNASEQEVIVVVQVDRVKDAELLAAYRAQATEQIRPLGAKVIARGGKPVEGAAPYPSYSLQRWPSAEAFENWQASEAYQPLRAMRLAAADMRLTVVPAV